ncbi:Hsp33 family molecular chaperone HslO, partial [Neisseria sp. P0017.S005]|uniref:Hsp33 family molecular chaperone HslO n=1 Tax=Neisseria sp. P0017.S005 TaxID=3436781 RepID=UPI003F7E5E32
ISDYESLSALLVEKSVFVLNHQPKDADRWQGVVPLECDSIEQMLVNYMKSSEQLDTYITLADDDKAAGALLLQRLPEEEL